MSSEWFEAGTPQTIAFARVRQRVEQRPFRPFRIVTTSGHSYDIPSLDHIGFLPLTRMILVAFDSGDSVDIPALHVAAIESFRRGRRRRAA